MSVCPGFGGQEFIGSTVKKISSLRKMLEERKPSVRIAVDGGVNRKNIKELYKAGADFFIVGSAVFRADDIEGEVRALKAALK